MSKCKKQQIYGDILTRLFIATRAERRHFVIHKLGPYECYRAVLNDLEPDTNNKIHFSFYPHLYSYFIFSQTDSIHCREV